MIQFTAAVALRASAAATLAILTTFAPKPLPAAADAGTVQTAGKRAATWLASQQSRDGGFGNGFTQGSDPSATADAVFALATAGTAPATLKSKGGRTPLDYLASQVGSGKLSTGQLAKVALAAHAAGADPRRFGGRDVVSAVRSAYDERTGVIGGSVYVHALALVALARSGEPIPARAITALEGYQGTAGGFSFTGAGSPDVDTTALAVQALISAGRPANTGPAGRGLGYLRSLQNADGGFPYESPSSFGTETNANSTALVVQAIIASGDQPESWAAAAGNPLSSLVRLQRGDGWIGYQASVPDPSVLATSGALPGLYRAPYGLR